MYNVIIERRVYKDLDKIPLSDVEKIYEQILALQQDPRPSGTKKLKGSKDRYRIRQGDYRIVYILDDNKKTVSIILVRHRKDVYRDS
ncbi:MAG: type II toxin-antitoxin system RelE/ParE family toxin [Candidatus Omnitrophica bacterium]|nr:type II toxin-antitoxin system RelE/ParE family toxin [Candidatus Omnitrophota bacterium]